MAPFIHDNFMLHNDHAEKLYHDYAKDMPIFDYHCHLDPKQIWENKQFRNLTEIWLGGDHYKWRAMRWHGVDETYITGDASDFDKFMAWAKTVPYTIGNPLYHWTHLELKRYFGIDELLSEETAEQIWEKANAQLAEDDFRTRGLISRSNVSMIGTTDDPTDTLEYHRNLREDTSFATKVVPSFRPDKGVEIRKPGFANWIKQLSEVVGRPIDTYEAFLAALEAQVHRFHEQGCRVSDHGLDDMVYVEASQAEVAAIFQKTLTGGDITREEEKKYKTATLLFLGRLYHEHDWTMQFHLGAMRNNSKRMFEKLGPDTGFDSINDIVMAEPFSRFLDALDHDNTLPKTILYNLNPTDNYVFATLAGNFQQGPVRGKVQFGAGWWYNDQKDGMLRQMIDLANIGLLADFVGMLTDSRSFLSYTRHEYFRRILCNLLGEWVELGEVPNDMDLLGQMVQNICYNNAVAYFGIS